MFSLVRITMLVPEGSTSGAVVRTCSGVVATRWEFCELLGELLCANDIAQQSATARANKLIRFMLPLLIQTIECRIQRLDAENRRAGKLVRRSNSEESYCGIKTAQMRNAEDAEYAEGSISISILLSSRLTTSLLASYCGLSSGRRFSVGRSSSLPLLLLPLLPLLPVRRNVGRLSLPLSLSLWRFSISAKRALTLSNSEVSRMYSGRGGRTFEISCWDFSIRSGVCGCVSKVLAMKPGFFFCKASIFSKNEMKAWG